VRSLTLKITFVFLLVSLFVVVLGSIFSRLFTVREFERLVINRSLDEFIDRVQDHYSNFGNIQNISKASNWQTRMPRWYENNTPSNKAEFHLESRMPFPGIFTLVDQEGFVVLPSGTHQLGQQLPMSVLSNGTVIEMDGEKIGVVLITGKMPMFDKRDEQFLNRIDQALATAALVAMVFAVLMAIFFARSLTRPIRELNDAIQEIAKGNLEQQVPIRSKDELGMLAASFNLMSRDLAKANQSRRQMTADIAHDLRTPLTVIGGYIEALRDGILKPSAERFETLYNEVQMLQRLVKDLRTLSLADAGELTLHRQDIQPNDLLRRIESSYRHAATTKGINFVLKTQDNLPTIFVDEERMIQVMGNLVMNAIQYTPKEGKIILASQASSEDIHISIIDTGKGITPESIKHIFNRFYRGDNSRSDKDGESGLGLAIAKSIMKAHGGDIVVKSELGKGSEFIIIIPMKK